MKKSFLFILIIFFVNFILPISEVCAKEKIKNIKDTNLQIVQDSGLYGLTDKNSGEEIMPKIYSDIKKVKLKNKTAIVAKRNDYISIYSPDGLYKDFLLNYYNSNNKLQNIKFQNYPRTGTIRYKQNNKYGLIYFKDDVLSITRPKYAKIEFPDDDSIAARMLNVSFAPLYNIIAYNRYRVDSKSQEYLYQTAYEVFFGNSEYLTQGYVFLNPADINESLEIKDNNLYVTYNGIEFPQKNYVPVMSNNKIRMLNLEKNQMTEYKNINIIPETQQPVIDSLAALYQKINNNSPLEVKNYPLEGLLKISHKLYLAENNSVHRLKGIYNDFNLNGSNLYLNKLTGLNLSFQPPENIIAASNGKWGIVDKEGNIKVPFIYDEIFAQNINVKEKITNVDDINAEKLILEYEGKGQEYNIFIAKKGRQYGVIDDSGNILAPFAYVKYAENNDLAAAKRRFDSETKELYRGSKADYFLEMFSYLLYPLSLLVSYGTIIINY